MASSFGKNIKITIFGQSHSAGIGVVIDGLPPGESIDLEEIGRFLARRAPGKNPLSTQRKEADIPKIISGIVNSKTCGAPLCAIIENKDTIGMDYENIAKIPRPSHADFTAFIKYQGHNDVKGGGHFSGRLTAPLCFAGAVCKQILEKKGIFIGTHIDSIYTVKDQRFDPVHISEKELKTCSEKEFPVLNEEQGQLMQQEILKAKAELDSVGGVIECCAIGVPVGLGEPNADGIENLLAKNVFSIPAVKGVEFGAGFFATTVKGSEHNDDFTLENDTIKTKTNHHGGILGGISSGMPILMRVAIKPTPSIGKKQQSVDVKKNENAELIVKGRHDPCIVPRAVPCVEAVMAITLLDLMQ